MVGDPSHSKLWPSTPNLAIWPTTWCPRSSNSEESSRVKLFTISAKLTKIGKNIGSLTDDARTFLTEDGPPAQNLRTFTTETLHRENRWICHYGLMAVAAIKKVHLIIWQYNEGEDEPWTKIAVISPNEDLKQLPAIHLAKDGGHYMPLISDTIQIPGNDLLGNGRVRRAKGIQSKIKKETKKNIRAGGGASGEHDPDAIRHTPNLKHDKADFEEETIEDLLKPQGRHWTLL